MLEFNEEKNYTSNTSMGMLQTMITRGAGWKTNKRGEEDQEQETETVREVGVTERGQKGCNRIMGRETNKEDLHSKSTEKKEEMQSSTHNRKDILLQ